MKKNPTCATMVAAKGVVITNDLKPISAIMPEKGLVNIAYFCGFKRTAKSPNSVTRER